LPRSRIGGRCPLGKKGELFQRGRHAAPLIFTSRRNAGFLQHGDMDLDRLPLRGGRLVSAPLEATVFQYSAIRIEHPVRPPFQVKLTHPYYDKKAPIRQLPPLRQVPYGAGAHVTYSCSPTLRSHRLIFRLTDAIWCDNIAARKIRWISSLDALMEVADRSSGLQTKAHAQFEGTPLFAPHLRGGWSKRIGRLLSCFPPQVVTAPGAPILGMHIS
jgi:hypothetical protein